MNLPIKKEVNSNIEDIEKMAEIVDEEDVQMFLVNNKRGTKKSAKSFGKYYHPRETIADYFKANKHQDLNSHKIEKFLEKGVLDNVLFNFLFARGMELKDGLIDINRAYAMIRKINENELDNPERVPDLPLDEDEKLEFVCEFLKKHPQLLLQAIPSSKKSPQRISLPNPKNKKNKLVNDSYSLFPKSTKTKKIPQKFKTVEREEFNQNAYSGINLRASDKIRFLKERGTSPAVPLPSHSRLTSQSHKLKNLDNTLSKEFKMVSKGINFEVEPFEDHPRQAFQLSNLQQKRKTYNEFMNANLKTKSRATTSELQKRPAGSRLMKQELVAKINVNTKFKDKINDKARPRTNACQKRVKSNVGVAQTKIDGTSYDVIRVDSHLKDQKKLYTLDAASEQEKQIQNLRQKK